MSVPGVAPLRPTLAPSAGGRRRTDRHAADRREPLGTVLTWSTAAMGAVISAEGAIPLSPSDRVLLYASSLPMAAVLVVSVARLVAGWSRTVVPAMVAPWIAFVSLAALTTVWSVSTAHTVDTVPVLASVGIVFLLLNLVQTPPGLEAALRRAVVLGGAAGAAWGLVNFLAGTLPVGGGGTPRFSAIEAPNATAAAMLLPFVLAFDAAVSPGHGLIRSGRQAVVRRLDASVAALIVTGIVITGSRGGLVAALVGALVVVAARGARLRPRALLLVALVIGGVFLASPPELQRHLTAAHSTGRTGLWSLGAEACADHCIVGSGFGSFPYVYTEAFRTSPAASGYHDADFRAHNIWLEAAVETGLIGIAVLIAAVGLTARHAWRAPPDRRPSALAALSAVLAATMFLSHLSFRYFWLVLIYVALVGQAGPRPSAEART
jgi:O-antigen ligase